MPWHLTDGREHGWPPLPGRHLTDGGDSGRPLSLGAGDVCSLSWVFQTRRCFLLEVFAFSHMILKSFMVFLQFYYVLLYILLSSPSGNRSHKLICSRVDISVQATSKQNLCVSSEEMCVFPKVWDHHVESLIYSSSVLTGALKLVCRICRWASWSRYFRVCL